MQMKFRFQNNKFSLHVTVSFLAQVYVCRTSMLTCSCMLRVELLQLAHRSEAHVPETVEGNGSFVDTLISLLCGVVCNNEQYNKPVGKATICYFLPRDRLCPWRCVVTIITKHTSVIIFDYLYYNNTKYAFATTPLQWTDQCQNGVSKFIF